MPAEPVTVPPVANLANGLTLLRLVLVPIFVVVLMHDGGLEPAWRAASAVIFAAAALTDQLDGRIARSRGIVTDFGKLADPIADKALVAAALICLSLMDQLSWWTTGIILGREVVVTAIRFGVKKHKVIAASWGGKIKTALQMGAITGYLLCPQVLNFGWLNTIVFLAMILAVAATVATGVDYAVTAWLVVRAAKTSPLAASHSVGTRAPVSDAVPTAVSTVSRAVAEPLASPAKATAGIGAAGQGENLSTGSAEAAAKTSALGAGRAKATAAGAAPRGASGSTAA
ncbi:MAG: CDP-diacylglycerol--glycerol-3-phosphate 3-phosphatidyltransferase, partial [Bifidobacteriaceae bacterium]|nr:CDP-diacylglycerol--glycerol-3-phosphate 3-phosphatidyltransferase [Bifidobacteriaceae bacterium]